MASKRILVVGGVAGGASCAARARRNSESAQIVVLERGPYASFANCGLPYHIGGVIAERNSLLVTKPETLRGRFNLDLRVNTEVTSIDRGAKTVEIRDTTTGATKTEHYDALVISSGAKSIVPPLPGIDLPGIFALRTIPDADSIKAWIDSTDAKTAVVVGGGFIGLEMAENLIARGIKVTIVEMLPQVFLALDPEMVHEVHTHLREKGVNLVLGDGAASFEKVDTGLLVKTQSGKTLSADMVVLGIGVRPEIDLAKKAGLTIGKRGGIVVDETLRTSDPNIWAVGDVVEKRDVVLGGPILLALAGPANRQGRMAADAIFGADVKFRGVQGTSVCGLFDLTLGRTGASEKDLIREGVAYNKVHIHPYQHVEYIPGGQQMHLKLMFEPVTGKILGAQCVGKGGVDKRIDVLAMALQMGATVFDLEESELCYAPQYGAAKDPVNLAGFVAANHLRGTAPLAHWTDPFDPATTVILDVRTPKEYACGHVEGALNIPVDELRTRLDELPRDKEIRAHCRVGVRSNIATHILRHSGFNVRNISGGWRTYEGVKAAGIAHC